MNANEFKFELDEQLKIEASDEVGVVIGRAQYSYSENGYLLRYRAGDGRATEQWWTESALIPKAG